VADCTRCFALCCELPFARGRDFPEDKAAGARCRNLAGNHECTVHAQLLDLGWRGCVAFDCFGAGQQVCQVSYASVDDPTRVEERAAVFAVVRQLHEMRFLLGDPGCAASSYADLARALDSELAEQAGLPPAALVAVDLPALRDRARDIFTRVAAERGGVDVRGTMLLAGDLRRQGLRGANLLGADLRDTDVRGADLSTALFLTQSQVNAARGDAATRLPARLSRPTHWLTVANQPG
jgi:hypothetical protein